MNYNNDQGTQARYPKSIARSTEASPPQENWKYFATFLANTCSEVTSEALTMKVRITRKQFHSNLFYA